jgi:hypothetical protein
MSCGGSDAVAGREIRSSEQTDTQWKGAVARGNVQRCKRAVE